MTNYGLEVSGNGLSLSLPWLDLAMNWEVLALVLIVLLIRKLDKWQGLGILTHKGDAVRGALWTCVLLWGIWWGMWQLAKLGLF